MRLPLKDNRQRFCILTNPIVISMASLGMCSTFCLWLFFFMSARIFPFLFIDSKPKKCVHTKVCVINSFSHSLILSFIPGRVGSIAFTWPEEQALWSLVSMETTHFLSNKIALSKHAIMGVRVVLPVPNAIRVTCDNGAGINGVLCLICWNCFPSIFKMNLLQRQKII